MFDTLPEVRDPFRDFDPELTRPRRFVAPPTAPTDRLRAALTTEKKMLEREAAPINKRLNEVREQLAALPAAA